LSKLDPTQTVITLPDDIPWRVPNHAPANSVAEAVMAGSEGGQGCYLVLMKWYPGWMSAPHTYETDRLCVVISGVWWCNSGQDFDPGDAVPVHPGGFVRRVAGTPHYDGAHPSAAEPAVIAVSGMAPVRQRWVDPSQPVLRQWAQLGATTRPGRRSADRSPPASPADQGLGCSARPARQARRT
jgi:hypothetical protein